MTSKHHAIIIKTLTVSLAVILGLGVFANSSSALFVCSAACCTDRRTSVDSHHTTQITAEAPSCCCSDTAAFPCEYTAGLERRLSPPALLRAHQVDHRDLTVDHADVTAAPAAGPDTTDSPASLCFASILKVPIYLSSLTFLC
jgi:hypothetical protein